jgi:hypothetical protein
MLMLSSMLLTHENDCLVAGIPHQNYVRIFKLLYPSCRLHPAYNRPFDFTMRDEISCDVTAYATFPTSCFLDPQV